MVEMDTNQAHEIGFEITNIERTDLIRALMHEIDRSKDDDRILVEYYTRNRIDTKDMLDYSASYRQNLTKIQYYLSNHEFVTMRGKVRNGL
jgi:pantothenate kinase